MRGGGRGGTRGLTRLPPSLQRLGGVEIKALNVAGITVNTWGGAWYTVAKYRMRLRRDREKGEKGEKGGGGGRPPGLPPLAGGPLARSLDAPLLLTAPDALSFATRDEIERLGATKAVVLGGAASLSRVVVDELERDLGSSSSASPVTTASTRQR